MIPKTINTKLLALLFLIILVTGVWYINRLNQPQEEKVIEPVNVISYIALGDSYTIGLGVNEEDRWPNVLTNHLKEAGLNVNLVENPAVTGYRVIDATQEELPVVQIQKPDFVTVLIGANDNFAQKDSAIYKQELYEFLNKLQPLLSNPKNIILITIPDYSQAPVASRFSTSGISQSIKEYNQVIKEEAKNRGIKVADIFPVSQTMTDPQDYTSDGLHPSAQGYIKWEKVIFPVVLELLKESINSFLP